MKTNATGEFDRHKAPIYGISSFIMDSGERFCHVIDRASGLPSFYPNLYLTTQVRNYGQSSATVEAAAANLVVLLRFLDSNDICIESRLLEGRLLREHELDALRDFTSRHFQKKAALPSDDFVVVFIGEYETVKTVNTTTQYSRLTTTARYLDWFARYLLVDPSPEYIDRINAMVGQIKERRPVRRGLNGSPQDRSLSDEQLDTLFEVIRLGSEHNPFSAAVQRRNRLMVLLLYHLGIRGGELLNIRISDIDFATNRVKIVRRADEKEDPRVREPNAKTLARTLPLADSLAKEIHEYITKDRRSVRNARRNDFLIVTHKQGPTVGQPVSKAGYHKVMAVVAAISPQLYAVTGHMLRHTWNRKFSEKMDAMDEPLSEARQEQIRSYLMGWMPDSGTAATYNKRFIQQKGFEAALAMQETSGTRAPKEFNNEPE